jgi:hypothetical protein
MEHNIFKITHKDDEMMNLIKITDKKTLAVWAIDCTKRVLQFFEAKYPRDFRPRQAISTLQKWIETGEFKLSVIRKASLDAHAAAREVGYDNPARSAARAAGQAVATAHVAQHAYGPAIYAQQAIFRATNVNKSKYTAKVERDWQYQHLQKLRGSTLNIIKKSLLESQ